MRCGVQGTVDYWEASVALPDRLTKSEDLHSIARVLYGADTAKIECFLSETAAKPSSASFSIPTGMLLLATPLSWPQDQAYKTFMGSQRFWTRHLQPLSVVQPKSVEVTVVGGGHSGHCIQNGNVGIDMSHFGDAEFRDGTVVLAGGCTQGDIVRCLPEGWVVAMGARPSVGMGLMLQGGIGHLTRVFGLASDNILSVSLVTSGGEDVTIDDDRLWAFRGAGTNFGVVYRMVVQAHRHSGQTWAQDEAYDTFGAELLQEYGAVCGGLCNSRSLDGFLMWASETQPQLVTSAFSLEEDCALQFPSLASRSASLIEGSGRYNMTEMFERELYMTPTFDTARVGVSVKARSYKRCLLLGTMTRSLALELEQVMDSVPSPKLSYIHLVHCGGVVKQDYRVTAFAKRDWEFAAVITGMWPDGKDCSSVVTWVDESVRTLLRFSVGVYPADLGPDDIALSRFCYGPAEVKLAQTKREFDPTLTISGFPFETKEFGACVVVTGRACAGKDYVADFACNLLAGLRVPSKVLSISEAFKREYCNATAADFDRLRRDRSYKESHRSSMQAFYAKMKSEDPSYPRRCLWRTLAEGNKGGVLFLTGVRENLADVRKACVATLVVEVTASDSAVACRGGRRVEGEGPYECDLSFDNTKEADEKLEQWCWSHLLPAVVRSVVGDLPDYPVPGIIFRDIQSVFKHRFGLKLMTEVFVRHLEDAGIEVDAVVSADAMGFTVGAALAARLCTPFIALRKAGKVPPPLHRTEYGGSFIAEKGDHYISGQLEVSHGLIPPKARVAFADDFLATGRTAEAVLQLMKQAGAEVASMLFAIELPDHGARKCLPSDVDIFSIAQFEGL
ncbi:apt [Symbiodinium sp. CCMP2592]|nr:apt [Symbiodinium sp. CCMP2592]